MKRAANLSVNASLLEEAKALGINMSQTFETSLQAAVKEARARKWQRDNRAALESSNAWAAENNLPLARYRQF